ncbi:MAG: hypothetical protein H0U87_00620 [Acidobacteria bacterium]|jgi:hypothetical protein|nr:hypothetical protein [Acidobacteriota bacterium]
MPTQERAVKGEKNKKTTEDPIPGKEKAKGRADGDSSQAENTSGENDRTDGGDENKKSNR